METVVTEATVQPMNDGFTGDIHPIQKWITINPNEHRFIDSTLMPLVPCYSCSGNEYWKRSDGGWVCGTCHPPPKVFSKGAI
jgi:hypothetical protein